MDKRATEPAPGRAEPTGRPPPAETGGRPPPAETGSRPPPAETGGDPILWAAWLYYGEDLTQNEVAHALGVSRTTVANHLAEARRRGRVRIELDPELLAQVSLGRRLAGRHGLDGAFVVPAEGAEDAGALRRRLGAAAAQALAPHLADGATIGVAWGRTMLELARALPAMALPRAEIVQLSGSSLGDAATSPEACTVLIAGRLGARCRNFHAPAVVTSRALAEALLAEPALDRHFRRLAACTVALFGVGELGPGTVWSDTDFLPPSVVEDYVAAGGAGVLIGRFLDRTGRELDGPLAGRQIGLALDALGAIPTRVCVAGGPAKVEAIRAALAGGYVTHLVTDAPTARALMEEAS
ncbi:MAG: sugar-binding transcriptional regulator [Paracoccaceae bacterium]